MSHRMSMHGEIPSRSGPHRASMPQPTGAGGGLPSALAELRRRPVVREPPLELTIAAIAYAVSGVVTLEEGDKQQSLNC